MVGPSRPQIVLFGSSIVQFSYANEGWGSILSDIYSRKADFFLRGYAGWNSRRALQVIDKIFPKEALTQPSLIIVYFGGNDSMISHPSGKGPHVPLPEYVDNMRNIVKYLSCLSDKTRVIVLSSPPVNELRIREFTGNQFDDLGRKNESCRIYAEALMKMCHDMNVKAINLWVALQKRDDWLNACFTDGIHLSYEGSKIVVEEILTILKEAEWEPNLHWKFLPTEFAEDSPYDLIGPDGKTTINVSETNFHWENDWD